MGVFRRRLERDWGLARYVPIFECARVTNYHLPLHKAKDPGLYDWSGYAQTGTYGATQLTIIG